MRSQVLAHPPRQPIRCWIASRRARADSAPSRSSPEAGWPAEAEPWATRSPAMPARVISRVSFPQLPAKSISAFARAGRTDAEGQEIGVFPYGHRRALQRNVQVTSEAGRELAHQPDSLSALVGRTSMWRSMRRAQKATPDINGQASLRRTRFSALIGEHRVSENCKGVSAV
jgi:hypothetical protein